jgi:hypothetical protein
VSKASPLVRTATSTPRHSALTPKAAPAVPPIFPITQLRGARLGVYAFDRRHRIRLEPISKSPEEDNEAGELDKAQEVLCVILPANEDPTLPLNPSKEALNEPSPHEAT